MQNLRDKLLQAGLVTKEQSERAETTAKAKPEAPRHPRPPPRHDAPRHARPPTDHARPERPERSEPLEKRIPRLPPLALPGSKAYQRLESLKQLELDKKLRLLVQEHEVPIDIGATVFYFMTRKGRLRRLTLTDPQAKLLEDGTLAVVERPEPASIEHSLVPRAAAERMLALSPKAVRFLNREGAPVGFMTDDELKARQVEEATAAPEIAQSEAERADEAGAEAVTSAQDSELDAAEAELAAHEARKASASPQS